MKKIALVIAITLVASPAFATKGKKFEKQFTLDAAGVPFTTTRRDGSTWWKFKKGPEGSLAYRYTRDGAASPDDNIEGKLSFGFKSKKEVDWAIGLWGYLGSDPNGDRVFAFCKYGSPKKGKPFFEMAVETYDATTGLVKDVKVLEKKRVPAWEGGSRSHAELIAEIERITGGYNCEYGSTTKNGKKVSKRIESDGNATTDAVTRDVPPTAGVVMNLGKRRSPATVFVDEHGIRFLAD